MNYYDSQEMRDYNFLTEFNNSIRWFEKMKPTPQFAHIDAVAKDYLGKKYVIELKERGPKYDCNKMEDVFIEPLKIEWLNKGKAKGAAPIYINIFNNGKDILVWDFRKPLTLKEYKNVRIWDKGASKYKYQDRFGLLINEATHFILKDGKYRLCQPQQSQAENQK